MAVLTEETQRSGLAPPRRVLLSRPSTWPAYWPFVVVVVGYPVWWLLGVSGALPILMAVPLARQLMNRRPVRLPRGSTWWGLFLVWVLASMTMLWVDAPSGVPGGGFSRVPVFTFRLLWLAASTIVLLWAFNMSEREVPTKKIVRIIGWMFVVTTAGGLLGVVAPTLELRSLVQMLLPKSLLSIRFIADLVKPSVASIQNVLGVEGGRPTAPFAYANSWGANLSLFLPFFLVGWCGRSAGWKRWPALVVVGLAVIPVVVSLNRGLWICLGLGVVYLLVRTALRGGALVALAGVVAIAALAGPLLGSQLGTMASSRLDHPHSNDRRGELLAATVSDTVSTSPIVGFGSTRDYRGSFASIAGGGTPECPACEVPPLGTQGQLWFVIFSQGIVGTAFFLAFFVTQLAAHWRSRTSIEAIGVVLLLFLAVQLVVYDTMELPVMMIMLGVGLMERRHPPPNPTSWEAMARWIRSRRVQILSLVVVGALIGLFLGVRTPVRYAATIPVKLEPVPAHLDLTSRSDPRSSTVDTEASLVYSERALDGVRRSGSGPAPDREDIRVTAVPNTRVILITVIDEDPDRAADLATALTKSFLDVRTDYYTKRRQQVLVDLQLQLLRVAGRGIYVDETADSDQPAGGRVRLEDVVRQELEQVTLTPTVSGEALRSPEVSPVGRSTALRIVSGALLGLLAGLVVAVLTHKRGRGPGRLVRRRGSSDSTAPLVGRVHHAVRRQEA